MANFSTEQVKLLEMPLHKKHVSERDNNGFKLSYIEGWHAIAEANRIFGYDAWSRETVAMSCVDNGTFKNKSGKEMFRIGYVAKVRVMVGNIIREGTGFGQGMGYSLGEAHEGAVKEAETDAMKRALMTFGNQFGLALYDKKQANVTNQEPIPEYTLEQQERDYNEVVENFDMAQNLDDLKDYWNKRGRRIANGLKANNKELYDDVMSRKEKLKQHFTTKG